jgi:hypothetical protein
MSPVGQEAPHSRVPPQLFEMRPQFSPFGQTVSGAQQTLFTQLLPVGQAGPQVTVPPQPFGIVPQSSPVGQLVVALQGVQTLPTQMSPLGQAGPQLTVPPQPFETVPQFSPVGQLWAHWMQTFCTQFCPVPQVPQSTLVPQESTISPQS